MTTGGRVSQSLGHRFGSKKTTKYTRVEKKKSTNNTGADDIRFVPLKTRHHITVDILRHRDNILRSIQTEVSTFSIVVYG